MVDGVSLNQAQQSTVTGRASLAQNYETFLQLLTAQLKNQDPLSPVDSNAFTAQLVQMAGVEQQILTNELLTGLVGASATGLNGAVQYIGKEVTAAGAAVRLQDGQATWSYELARQAEGATLEILNGQGEVVWRGAAPELGEGVHDFTWDGRNSAGDQLADGGVYTLRISAAAAGGAPVDSQVLIRGRVTAVELYDGQPYVTVGGSVLPLSQIISVAQPAAAPAPTGDEADSILARLNPMKLFS
ncbi:flagellar hook assembly protein FlgD [Brevundimonas sp. 2R-24]|uniref:Basal-body rod modification protein FlgD n=1 Tax=Peiella sedimenti TaxID=3061083 RepID=A0ABT8SNK6_9CAUL|nr:flagellar hook assembly protein FlgD [Caulobacteraceae bacterium XZ-24]